MVDQPPQHYFAIWGKIGILCCDEKMCGINKQGCRVAKRRERVGKGERESVIASLDKSPPTRLFSSNPARSWQTENQVGGLARVRHLFTAYLPLNRWVFAALPPPHHTNCSTNTGATGL
jgi:hypothetical protein